MKEIEVDIPVGVMPEKYRKDCISYQQAMERLRMMGIEGDKDAVIYLQREVDNYRKLIEELVEELEEEKAKNMCENGFDGILLNDKGMLFTRRNDEGGVEMPILKSMPKDLRDRISSIELSADGNLSIYFDTYFERGENNERPVED